MWLSGIKTGKNKLYTFFDEFPTGVFCCCCCCCLFFSRWFGLERRRETAMTEIRSKSELHWNWLIFDLFFLFWRKGKNRHHQSYNLKKMIEENYCFHRKGADLPVFFFSFFLTTHRVQLTTWGEKLGIGGINKWREKRSSYKNGQCEGIRIGLRHRHLLSLSYRGVIMYKKAGRIPSHCFFFFKGRCIHTYKTRQQKWNTRKE